MCFPASESWGKRAPGAPSLCLPLPPSPSPAVLHTPLTQPPEAQLRVRHPSSPAFRDSQLPPGLGPNPGPPSPVHQGLSFLSPMPLDMLAGHRPQPPSRHPEPAWPLHPRMPPPSLSSALSGLSAPLPPSPPPASSPGSDSSPQVPCQHPLCSPSLTSPCLSICPQGLEPAFLWMRPGPWCGAGAQPNFCALGTGSSPAHNTLPSSRAGRETWRPRGPCSWKAEGWDEPYVGQEVGS